MAAGTVIRAQSEMVAIHCGNRRAFEYWHIAPRVQLGQRVVPGRTKLGRIMRGEAHVHLTELAHGFPVNPVRSGALGPYRDATTPRVVDIALRTSGGAPRGRDARPPSA